MIRRVIKVVPLKFRQSLKKWWRHRQILNVLKENYSYDRERFSNFAAPSRQLVTADQHRAMIMVLNHSIEKGLSLENTRKGFGLGKVRALIELLENYDPQEVDETEGTSALATLDQYAAHACDFGEVREEINSAIDRIRAKRKSNSRFAGGIREITKREIEEHGKLDLEGFFHSRFSIRQFTGHPVADSLISQAVVMAQKTPSVCNRQSSRVHVFANDELGRAALACQSGNRGFGDQVGKILVVTSELGNFLSVGERNQCWIDGGMFAMSLVYALHSLGLGTCCLNWSVERDVDEKLREVADISPSENVIMMIAVGEIPPKLDVAYSERLPLEQVAKFHRAGAED